MSNFCSFKVISNFLETQVGLYPVPLQWLKENVKQYKQFQDNFSDAEGYEQAGAMHDCGASDTEFCAFYNYNKLDGNPLMIEIKEAYGVDDVFGICYKTSYPIEEGMEFCFRKSEKEFIKVQIEKSSKNNDKS